MNALDLISRAQAMPMTHRVTTTYADGATKIHDARSEGAAENFATGERRKVGRCLVSRDTGKTVQVVSVVITAL